jgi:hypothetical protein
VADHSPPWRRREAETEAARRMGEAHKTGTVNGDATWWFLISVIEWLRGRHWGTEWHEIGPVASPLLPETVATQERL